MTLRVLSYDRRMLCPSGIRDEEVYEEVVIVFFYTGKNSQINNCDLLHSGTSLIYMIVLYLWQLLIQ